MTALALIPARGGSKGVPGKNIRPLGGYPLIAYSIAAAQLAKGIDRVIVSTDSDEIAEIAERFGAEVPFRRPAEYASDSSSDADVFRHALSWLDEHEGKRPRFFVHLRPTTPLRDPGLIDAAIEAFDADRAATSLRSAHELSEPPQKMLGIEDGVFVGLFPDDPRPEYFNLPRQAFPPAYHPNGYVDVLDPARFHGDGIHGSRILAFITPSVTEVDRSEDFEYLEYTIARHGHPLHDWLKEKARV